MFSTKKDGNVVYSHISYFPS